MPWQKWKENHSYKNNRHDCNTDHVEVVGHSAYELACAVNERGVKADACGEFGKPLVKQVVADMTLAAIDTRIVAGVVGSLSRKFEDRLSYLGLVVIGELGYKCDALAVGFAAFEVHAAVGLRGVLAEQGIESHKRLDDGDPVSVVDETETLHED